MKLSTHTIMNQPVKAMLEQQEALNKVQRQLATGKNILQPSDDPSGSARANQLRDAMGRTNQYIVNGDTAEARLSQEESIFSSMVNSMQRVRELAIQSLSGTYSDRDRMGIGAEIEHSFQEIMGLANTRSANGEYLFGGYKNDIKPFDYSYTINSVLTSQSNIGAAVATTSAGTNGVVADVLKFSGDVSASISIVDNEEASSIAAKINADASLAGFTATASNAVTITVPNSAQTYASGYTFSINGNPVAVQDFTGGADLNSLAAAIQAADASLTATVSGPDIIITNATGADIRIGDVSDGLATSADAVMTVNGVVLDEAGGTKSSNDSIVIGGQVQIDDLGVSVDYQITATHEKNVMRSNLTQSKDMVSIYNGDNGQRDIRIGDNVKIQMNDAGNELFMNLPSAVDPSVNKSLFNMLYDFMSDLQAGVRPSDDILTDIDTAMGQVETTRAAVGSRLNIIDRQRSINEDYSIFSQQNISRIEDLDMAEAISLLEQQLLSLQVLQQTFSRVSGLSMFNYL
jgi:flagellar hook-associated protein 3 FlgL